MTFGIIMDSENLADKAMHEHSRLIRESSEYRNLLMMEELLAEMQPPITLQETRDLSITDKNNIIGERSGEGLLRGDVIEYTGRYKELAKIGYDESYQKNRRGIITRLSQLEREMQEHFQAHLGKEKPDKYTIK